MAFYEDCLAPSGVYRYYKDGQWLESNSGKVVKIINPSTNQPQFSVQGGRPPAQPPLSNLPRLPCASPRSQACTRQGLAHCNEEHV